jgi:head-tail adaptor
MSWNVQGDFMQVVDGLRPAMLRRRESGAVHRLEHTLQRGARWRDGEASNGHCAQLEARWHLDAGELVDAPRLGDTIEEATGRQWEIVEVSPAVVETKWICRAVAIELSERFPQRIVIQRAVVWRGAHGEVNVRWEDWQKDIPARIQPVGARARTENDQRVMRASHTIFVAETLDLGGDVRVLEGTTVYQVVGYSQPEQLGEWFAIDTVVAPWMWSEGRS